MPELIETLDFVAESTDRIATAIRSRQAQGDVFRLSLCGGSTPAPIYAALSAQTDIDWQRVLITFGDERCVGPEDEQSNYRMARENFLTPAGVSEKNVIRMEGELDPPQAAVQCEQRLKELAEASGDKIFQHDLVLLGMGDDGHTASLFPGTEALKESQRWVLENFVPQQDSWRLTMTYPLINAAAEVLFLVSGEKKRAIVDEIFAGNADYPAAGVSPKSGRLTWLAG